MNECSILWCGKYHQNWENELHCHNYFQMVGILSGSGTVTIQQAGYGKYLGTTKGSSIGGGYWKYTSNDGLTGTAYCVNHGLKGVSPSKALTVQPYNRNPQTMGVFASGYPNRTLEQFKELHQDDVRGVNALTEDEYKYATQLAIWASCGQLAIVCKRSPSVLRQTVTEYCREHNRSRKRDQKSDCCKDRFISPHQIRYHNETSFLLQYYIQIIFLIDLITAQSIPNAFLAR